LQILCNGINIYEFFRGERSWRQFYSFLDQLPPHSKYKSALVMDPEWVQLIIEAEEKGEPAPPGAVDDNDIMSPSGYDEIVSRLDLIADRVMGVRASVVASVHPKHKEPDWKPLPRPRTLLDIAREARTRNVLLEVDALIMGGGLEISDLAFE
jgi:hypothetical protein